MIFSFCILLFTYTQVFALILVQNQYFPKPGKEREAYEWRIRASAIREKLGLSKGRILIRENLSDRPYLIWECEFTTNKDREMDVETLGKSKEFNKVEKHMGKLLIHFERVVWKVKD